MTKFKLQEDKFKTAVSMFKTRNESIWDSVCNKPSWDIVVAVAMQVCVFNHTKDRAIAIVKQEYGLK